MRVNLYNQNLANYKAKHQIKSFANKSTTQPMPCLTPDAAFGKYHLPVFTGLLLMEPVEKTFLPETLQDADGEIYKIKLFDKIEKEEVPAFLRFTDYNETLKDLIIHDEEGEMIGRVWINKTPSSDNYLRLHSLESYKHDQYLGIGSTLVQAAIEKSLETDAHGKIFVHAYNMNNKKNDPFVFYNKMGLSVVTPWNGAPYLPDYTKKLTPKEIAEINQFESEDRQILELYKKMAAKQGCKMDEVYLDFTELMYLHDGKVQNFWLPRIQANPIFCDQNRVK